MNMLFPGTEAKKAALYDVLYIPKLMCNLFSVRAAVAKGNAVEFGPNNCCIWDENGKLRGKGSLSDKLYQLHCQLLNCHFAKDVWQERCVENRFPQWERFS